MSDWFFPVMVLAFAAWALWFFRDKKVVRREHQLPPLPPEKDQKDCTEHFRYYVEELVDDPPCPDCGSKNWQQGPGAGICQNVKCGNDLCGSQFNVAMVPGQLLLAERI